MFMPSGVAAASADGPTPQLSNIVIFKSGPGFNLCEFIVYRNGDISVDSVQRTDEWLLEDDKFSTAGDFYEIRCTKTAGNLLLSGIDDNTWESLSATFRTLNAGTSGTGTYEGTIEIRRRFNSSNIASATISFGIGTPPPVLPPPLLSDVTINKIAPGVKRCEFIAYRNGDFQVDGTQRVNEWVTEINKEPTLGDLYEIRCTKSGGGLTLSGIADNTWVTLSSDLTIFSESTASDSYTGTLEIRQIADTSNNASANISFGITNVVPGPPAQLTDITISKSGPGFNLCEFVVYRNGDLEVDGSQRTNEWLLAGDKSTTVGDQYEMRCTKTGGNLLLSGIDDNTWEPLTSTSRTLNAGTSGTGTYTGTLEIRDIFFPANTASASISFGINTAPPPQPGPNLTDVVITKVGLGVKQCEFIAYRNGDLEVDGSVRTNEWLNSGDKGPTIGDNYEIRCTKTGGGLTLSGITDDTWEPLSLASRAMNVQSTMSDTYSGTLSIREIANTANIDTANIVLTITDSTPSPTPQLSNISISKSGFGFKLCEFVVSRNGNLQVDGTQRPNEWLLAADKTSIIGDQYEIRCVKTGGSLTLSGIDDNTWVTLSATNLNLNAGTSSAGTYTGTIEIREIAVPTNIANATINFNITT